MYLTNTESDRELLRSAKLSGAVIGVTTGCFDLIHPLHVRYLEKCKSRCETLIVGVDCDANVKWHKKRLPVASESDRAFMVSSLKCVDATFVMNCIRHLEEVLDDLVENRCSPDQIIQLYKSRVEYYGAPVLEVFGVETVIIADEFPTLSTTKLIKHIQKKYQKI